MLLLKSRHLVNVNLAFWAAEKPIIILTDYAQIVETFQKDSETYAGRQEASKLSIMLKGYFN